MIVIDTSIAIEVERGRELLSRLRGDAPLAVAAITVSELMIGAYLAESRSTRTRVMKKARQLLASVRVLDFTSAVAQRHARLRARLEKKGLRTGAFDLLIAATAVAHGYRLATLNPRDFESVPGLRLVPLGV